MNDIEVLVLNGAPGSGKSTLANAIAEQLRQIKSAHAVIDIDELNRVYPEAGNSLQWKNLSAVWVNYTALPNLKVILPVLIDSKEDLEALRVATPCNKLTICELIADDSILKDRVIQREPNEYWQDKLRGLVENYSKRDSGNKFYDFQVRTDVGSVTDSAKEIISHLAWNG